MTDINAKLQEIGIEIPNVSAPAAAYVPYSIAGDIVYISGQLPFVDGTLSHTGHLGEDVNLGQGQECAKNCAINVLAHLKNACDGDLNKVKRFHKIEILVAAKPEFSEPHLVANGASQLILDIFGEDIGSHARVAYGVAVLPMNVAVEVAATVEVS